MEEIFNIDELLDNDSICNLSEYSSESETSKSSKSEIQVNSLETYTSFFGKNYAICKIKKIQIRI